MNKTFLYSIFFHLFCCLSINSQVIVNSVIECEKYIKLEYINYNDFPIEIDNISLRNIDEKCRTKKMLNSNYYKLSNDTLIFDFDRSPPRCLAGRIVKFSEKTGYDANLKYKKSKVEPNSKIYIVFQIPLEIIKKVNYLRLNYILYDKEQIVISNLW